MKENQLQIFQYNGSPITFNNGDRVMVNATEMAKPFGKRTNDFLSSKSTQELIASLSVKTGIPATGLVVVNQGGNNQGTWLHEDLALIFAQWLSPTFYLWCNDRIKELLTKGTTSITQLSRKELALMIVQAEEEKERLMIANERQQATIEQQNATIQEQAPKVSYYDETLQSVNTLTTTQIAKELGLDASKLNQRLKAAGVIFRQSGMWMLRQPYSSWNMTATRTQTYTRSDGSTGTSIYTVWNERGRRFIHALHDCEYNARKARKSLEQKGGAE